MVKIARPHTLVYRFFSLIYLTSESVENVGVTQQITNLKIHNNNKNNPYFWGHCNNEDVKQLTFKRFNQHGQNSLFNNTSTLFQSQFRIYKRANSMRLCQLKSIFWFLETKMGVLIKYLGYIKNSITYVFCFKNTSCLGMHLAVLTGLRPYT